MLTKFLVIFENRYFDPKIIFYLPLVGVPTWKIHRVPDSCKLVNWDQLFFLLPAESDRLPLLLPKLLLPLLTEQGKDTGSRILSEEDESSPDRSCMFVAGLEIDSSKMESSINSLRCWFPNSELPVHGIVSLLPPCDVRPQAKNILAPSLRDFRWPGINFLWLWLSLPPPTKEDGNILFYIRNSLNFNHNEGGRGKTTLSHP